MAKGGKLTKLKSVLKKWHSVGRISRTDSSISAGTASSNDDYKNNNSASASLHAVYVGKSRRPYLISSDIMDNPMLQELVERSGRSNEITVDCEVVLFEHFLWMLENADPQPESLDELVGFYAR